MRTRTALNVLSMNIYDDDSCDYGYEGPMCDLRSTPLHDAAAAKDLFSVRSLLNSSTDINAPRDGQMRSVAAGSNR